ncbi:bacterial lipid A biosynthesis acyltransferase family protein, partial [Chlamydia psittaci 06-1683]
DNFFLT